MVEFLPPSHHTLLASLIKTNSKNRRSYSAAAGCLNFGGFYALTPLPSLFSYTGPLSPSLPLCLSAPNQLSLHHGHGPPFVVAGLLVLLRPLLLMPLLLLGGEPLGGRPRVLWLLRLVLLRLLQDGGQLELDGLRQRDRGRGQDWGVEGADFLVEGPLDALEAEPARAAVHQGRHQRHLQPPVPHVLQVRVRQRLVHRDAPVRVEPVWNGMGWGAEKGGKEGWVRMVSIVGAGLPCYAMLCHAMLCSLCRSMPCHPVHARTHAPEHS